MNVYQIRELKDYYVNELYSQVRKEQATDDEFYNDVFKVPQIDDPSKLQRTGRAARLIDSPAENIITSNPQVFVKALKDAQNAEKRADSVAVEYNKWLSIMKRANPNPFKEFVKNNLLRGEGWIQLMHNEGWVTGKKIKKGLPVIFDIPDPMIIYADPSEDEDGIPKQVIVFYEISPRLVKSKFSDWTNPKSAGNSGNVPNCRYLAYYNEEIYYMEADGEPLLKKEFNDNLYGFVPFIHKLSGFGKKSPEGKMEDLVVSRLRKSRALLTRECAIVSDIDRAIHYFSNRSIDVQPEDDQHQVPLDFQENYIVGAGQVNELPPKIKVSRSVEMLPEAQVFQHLHDISAQLEREDPMAMNGLPVGESGRLQDMVNTSAMRRYLSIVENTEYAFTTAFEKAMTIMQNVPTLTPESLTENELKDKYSITLKLKAEDPLDNDRKATLGSRLFQNSEIDIITNLVDYKGYTQDKAKQIVVDTLKWKVLLNNPDIANLIGMRAAQKSGMAEDLQIVKQRQQQLGTQQQAMGVQPQPRPPEVNTPQGREMIDLALAGKGARQAPSNYTRG
jgi:hypothetical protein